MQKQNKTQSQTITITMISKIIKLKTPHFNLNNQTQLNQIKISSFQNPNFVIWNTQQLSNQNS